MIRRVTSIGRAGAAPSRSPRARLAAKASRVRWLISRRSYCEPEMMMFAAISPAGVLVSMSRSAKCSAQPSRAARSIKTRTVHHRATQPVHLGHQQSAGLAGAHRLQGRKRGRPALQGFGTDALVAVLPHDRQPLAFGVSSDGRPLGFEPKTGERLFGCRHAQIGDHRSGWRFGAAAAPTAAGCGLVNDGVAHRSILTLTDVNVINAVPELSSALVSG